MKELEARAKEDRKKNKEVEDRYRRLSQENGALTAKMMFLKEKLDFKSNVKKLNIEDFRQLVMSNSMVNESIASFLEKLNVIKTETMKMEMEMEYSS